MELYLSKSAACLAILLLFYKLLLECENMHVFKRFYLLTSAIAAMVIPLVTFTTYVEPSGEAFQHNWISSEATNQIMPVNYWPYVLSGIYLLGVLFFSIKFVKNLRNLILKIRRNPKIRENGITNVLLSEKTPPHTFFHYIFFNKQKYLRNEIHQDVRIHEEAHARQKHSCDVIFVELLQIIFWVNPLIFILKNYIKLNHEFLADRAVLLRGYSTSVYQQTLLSYSSGDLQSGLVNPINYSSIKKRFKVMKTQTSKTVIWARGLLLLPLLAILLFGFSTKEVAYKASLQNEKFNELEIGAERFQDKATPEMFKEYTELVNYYNNKSKDCPIIRQDDANKIELYLSKMSPEQLEKAVKLKCKLLTPLSGKLDSDIKSSQDQATPEMIKEYTELIKYYNNKSKDCPIIRQDDVVKIRKFLNQMSSEQLEKAVKLKCKMLGATLSNPELEIKSSQERATPEMIAEYNKLVVYYNSLPKGTFKVNIEQAKRLKYIFSLMTSEQKEKSEKIRFDVTALTSQKINFYDLAAYGAKFYFRGKSIDVDKARDLVEFQKVAYVELPMTQNIVRLTEKNEESGDPTSEAPLINFYDLAAFGAKFYYKGKSIDVDKARDLVEFQKIAYVELPMTQNIIRLTEKKEVSGDPTTPAPSINFYDLAAYGAKFYYKGKSIDVDKARDLVDIQKIAYVELPITENIVRLTNKKEVSGNPTF